MNDITLPGKLHQRAMTNLRDRHERQVKEDALRISEHIGYVLNRISNGKASSAGLYVGDLAATIARMGKGIAALEALDEGLAILTTTNEPAELATTHQGRAIDARNDIPAGEQQ